MNQIEEFKTPKGEFIAVLIPHRFASAFANMGYLVCKVVNPATDIAEDKFFPLDVLDKELKRVSKLPENIDVPAIKLPEGEWRIMGIASKLTADQCSEIVVELMDSSYPFEVKDIKDTFLDLIAKLGMTSYKSLILKKV